jgi:hemerythrin-like domain-containing protein
MGDIKSAREIAMEKINQIGEPTEEERLEWKYLPEGEKLAARYLRENHLDLAEEVSKFDKKANKYIVRGASGVLIKNIVLPENDWAKKTNKQALEGIRMMKSDKGRVDTISNQIKQLFNHYAETGEKQKKQAYAMLKQDFQAKLEQAIRQSGQNMSGIRIDVEKQPQFQEEWMKMKAQIDGQYLQLLNDYKKALEAAG